MALQARHEKTEPSGSGLEGIFEDTRSKVLLMVSNAREPGQAGQAQAETLRPATTAARVKKRSADAAKRGTGPVTKRARGRKNSSPPTAQLYVYPIMRTVEFSAVKGRDYIFEYGKYGQGYFVILCCTGSEPFHFRRDPFQEDRLLHHFRQQAHDTCHSQHGLFRTTDTLNVDMLVERYAYRVTHRSRYMTADVLDAFAAVKFANLELVQQDGGHVPPPFASMALASMPLPRSMALAPMVV